MMYSHPYGMYRPYYSYYNRYGARTPSLTEGCVWNSSVGSAKNNLGYNVGQVQSSKQTQTHKQRQSQVQTPKCEHSQPNGQVHKHAQVQGSRQPQDLKQQNDRCDEKPIFDFLGIRLFSDDLLILAILYFLYSEGVKDPELFIALILLLIS